MPATKFNPHRAAYVARGSLPAEIPGEAPAKTAVTITKKELIASLDAVVEKSSALGPEFEKLASTWARASLAAAIERRPMVVTVEELEDGTWRHTIAPKEK